jgi:hypothetical protein
MAHNRNATQFANEFMADIDNAECRNLRGLA